MSTTHQAAHVTRAVPVILSCMCLLAPCTPRTRPPARTGYCQISCGRCPCCPTLDSVLASKGLEMFRCVRAGGCGHTRGRIRHHIRYTHRPARLALRTAAYSASFLPAFGHAFASPARWLLSFSEMSERTRRPGFMATLLAPQDGAVWAAINKLGAPTALGQGPAGADGI